MTCAAEDSGLPGRGTGALTPPPHLYPVLAMKYRQSTFVAGLLVMAQLTVLVYNDR